MIKINEISKSNVLVMTSKELSNRQLHCLRIIGLTLLLYSLNIIRFPARYLTQKACKIDQSLYNLLMQPF